MNKTLFNSPELKMNPLAAFSVAILSLGLGFIGLINITQTYKEKQRARLYDIATNTTSTDAIPGLLLQGNKQKALNTYNEMWDRINENQRDTTAPSIFTTKELRDFKARFGTWDSFYTNYVNQESRELEQFANERVYNLSKPRK